MAAPAALAAGADAPPATAQDRPQPVREYTDANGRLCRVYAREIVIDGTKQQAYATVCRDANGRWVLAR
jgi:surface antigen